jgi:hypothetical protein
MPAIWPASPRPEPRPLSGRPCRRGGVIEIERTVSASGNISVGNHIISAGLPLAGQRVTLRLEGLVAHSLANGALARTIACPVCEHARTRLRGARAGTASPPQLPEPLLVKRRVSMPQHKGIRCLHRRAGILEQEHQIRRLGRFPTQLSQRPEHLNDAKRHRPLLNTGQAGKPCLHSPADR